MTGEEFLKSLVHGVVPAPQPVGPKRMRRRWLARTHVRITGDLKALAQDIERDVRLELQKLYESEVEFESLRACHPFVVLTVVDDFHLLIDIEGPSASAGVGDAVVVVEWGILRRVDKKFRFDDLQGLPRACWTLYLDP